MSKEGLPFNLVKGEELLKYYKQPGMSKNHCIITNKRVVIFEGELLGFNYSYISVYLKSVIGVRYTVKKAGFGDVFLVTFNGNPIELKILDAKTAKEIEELINKLILE